MEKIRVLIVEDHLMVRDGLKQLIELEDDILVVGLASNGLQAIEKIEELKPDIVILDINLPKLNGLEVLSNLRKSNNLTKVLILTIHNEVEYLFKAVELGVNGYVLKDSESEVLISAVRTIHNGESYIQPNMASKLFDKMNNKEKENNKTDLTKREYEVLKLITKGLLNKEIANELNISEKTVKNHVSNIFKKIDVSDRTQAAVYAIKNNFVDIYQNN